MMTQETVEQVQLMEDMIADGYELYDDSFFVRKRAPSLRGDSGVVQQVMAALLKIKKDAADAKAEAAAGDDDDSSSEGSSLVSASVDDNAVRAAASLQRVERELKQVGVDERSSVTAAEDKAVEADEAEGVETREGGKEAGAAASTAASAPPSSAAETCRSSPHRRRLRYRPAAPPPAAAAAAAEREGESSKYRRGAPPAVAVDGEPPSGAALLLAAAAFASSSVPASPVTPASTGEADGSIKSQRRGAVMSPYAASFGLQVMDFLHPDLDAQQLQQLAEEDGERARLEAAEAKATARRRRRARKAGGMGRRWLRAAAGDSGSLSSDASSEAMWLLGRRKRKGSRAMARGRRATAHGRHSPAAAARTPYRTAGFNLLVKSGAHDSARSGRSGRHARRRAGRVVW
eukprot:PLAT7033.2.p1 GENE.PLAT7033.2~~PLAT7033.2.p1  ORF type:complete len:404 (+),score=127.05 PLAT7033.2:72-1283(+)